MTRKSVGLAVAACLCVSLAGAPARAAAAADLYVDNSAESCSDAGGGSQTQPFCTLAAAAAVVTAGQTVHINGYYDEPLTITRSGTPDQPITFMADRFGDWSMDFAGITIDEAHDVSIIRTAVYGDVAGPGITVRNSTGVTLEQPWLSLPGATSAGIQLIGVTDSTITNAMIQGDAPTGLVLDGLTNDVLIEELILDMRDRPGNVGIEVSGSRNTLANVEIYGGRTVGLRLNSGAADNVIVNTSVSDGSGVGIHNAGATGTAITNNTIGSRCRTGIRVDGNSTGVSVQNNVLYENGGSAAGCDPSVTDQVNIGIYDNARGSTVVDYNTVDSQRAYAWQVPMSLSGFRAASGQAAHDNIYGDFTAFTDSANSAAPGWRDTDELGRIRLDDPSVPNTGAGPVTYADRGFSELYGFYPYVSVTAQRVRGGSLITADASGSTVWDPFVITTYKFDFGDGTTVTQTSPIAYHRYGDTSSHPVTVTVNYSDQFDMSYVAEYWRYVQPPRRPFTR